MPLLMTRPETGPLPLEADLVIAGGAAALVPIGRGQLLSIEALEGGQVAALFAWVDGDTDEWLSPHHTRVFGGTFHLRMGTRLVTNRRRPMFVVGRDSLRHHDLLLPASVRTVDAVSRTLVASHVDVGRIADPVNVFLHANLGIDGRIDVQPSPARPGERWTVRALIDGLVAVAAGPTGLLDASADPPRRLRVRITNRVEDLPVDLPIWAG